MKPSLLRDLLAWTLAALLVVWASFLLVGLRTGAHEADELTDGHLASVAALLLGETGATFGEQRSATADSHPGLKRHDYQQSMNVIVWRPDGTVLTHIGGGPLPPFADSEGFIDLRLGNPPERWRAFSQWDGPQRERRITVMLSVKERDALAWDIAEQLTEPGLWLMPVIALVLGLAIRRGLTPLYELSNEVHQLEVTHGGPLSPRQRHAEFEAVVQAINLLVERQRNALARERQLASEFAHELRTPLAALALHARSLRGELDATEREHALERLEREALRAGEVLSLLLQLARASRADMAETAVPFDVAELARSVVADYAQRGLDRGHELAFEGDGPFPLTGHPVLMELAMRNLLDNAVGHTPPGTLVEVQIDPQARWLQVCDNGAGHVPENGVAAPSADSKPTLGLGLGHRVVEKIAAIHHAGFAAASPPPGFSVCYRLSFSPATSNDDPLTVA